MAKNDNKDSTVLPPSTVSINPPQENDFSARDFDYLNENEHFRYLSNSKKVGHAVIKKDKYGNEIAVQYALPQSGKAETPNVRPLLNIEAIERKGARQFKAEKAARNGETPMSGSEEEKFESLHRYRAVTPVNHTPMFATRFLHLELGQKGSDKLEEMDIAYFSPKADYVKYPEPFWGDNETTVPLFKTKLSKADKRELKAEQDELKTIWKGGQEVVVDHASVMKRDEKKDRGTSQNTVMGESAKDAYEAFFKEWTHELHPVMAARLERAIGAPLKNAFKSNHRPEWLHLEAHSLTNLKKNPQVADNLAAAPKWANTEMMVLERIAKWFALNRPKSFIKLLPHFEMLLNSHIAKKIEFQVTVEEKDRFIKMIQTIHPFIEYPLYRKASDVAQGAAITYNLLHQIPPVKEQAVINSTNKSIRIETVKAVEENTSDLVSARSGTNSSSLSHSLPSLIPNESKPSVAQSLSTTGMLLSRSAPANKTSTERKKYYPTQQKHEKSLVQITTTSQEPDYEEPWNGSRTRSSSGTGLVIEHQGKKYILTNAHCVENAVFSQVRLANDRKKKYEAKRKCVSYQCDLALLEVDDPEFLAKAEPVEFGGMVALRDKIVIMGFPMGGNEISVTKGIGSRIEVSSYSMSQLDMLQVQVDAAINPGNSGGPAFSGDKVVGIAFQGYTFAQNLGYIIPMPIISHFLKEAFSGKPYRGFPILPIVTQTLESPFLREHYQMSAEQTGVRISKIDNLCDAFNKLKPDDILLEIDSLPISNEGTVDIPGVGNCIDMIHVTHMKYIGDTVKLKVLRNHPETKKAEILDIHVELDRVPLETEMVPQTEYDKAPTYYIASGISFVPLSRNYLEVSDLNDYYLADAGCSIADMPKKMANQQFVVINAVLDCKDTQGYEGCKDAIVKEINGKPINNLQELIAAVESNTAPTLSVTLSSRNKIVVRNMPKHEHDALLKRYRIKSDRSEDLLENKSYASVVELSDHKEIPAPVAKSIQTSQSNHPESVRKRPKKMVQLLESDDEMEEKRVAEMSPVRDLPKLKGLQRFFESYVPHLEERVKSGELEKEAEAYNSEEDEDFDVRSDATELSSDEASEAESVATSEKENKDEVREQRRVSERRNNSQFFNKKRHQAPVSDEEDERVIKKQRRMR